MFLHLGIKTGFMKSRLVIASLLIVALFAGAPAFAQSEGGQPGLEHNLMISAGMFAETGSSSTVELPGLALRVSYGLGIPIAEKWSLMPGAGVKGQMADFFHSGWFGYIGSGNHSMVMGDLFCSARYHVDGKRWQIVYGLGPQVLYIIVPDNYPYSVRPNPNHENPIDPISGQETFHRWGLALMPSVVFQRGEHWQWGFEASIGLNNMMVQYPDHSRLTGSIYLHNLLFTCGWRF